MSAPRKPLEVVADDLAMYSEMIREHLADSACWLPMASLLDDCVAKYRDARKRLEDPDRGGVPAAALAGEEP